MNENPSIKRFSVAFLIHGALSGILTLLHSLPQSSSTSSEFLLLRDSGLCSELESSSRSSRLCGSLVFSLSR